MYWYIIQQHKPWNFFHLLDFKFLDPTGAQEVLISVCLFSSNMSSRTFSLHLLSSQLRSSSHSLSTLLFFSLFPLLSLSCRSLSIQIPKHNFVRQSEAKILCLVFIFNASLSLLLGFVKAHKNSYY